MATIKAYTNLQQSKKLAEILPIESADMHYNDWNDDFCVGYKHTGEYIVGLGAPITIRGELEIPCWSLAALLDILPQFIEFKSDKYYLRFMKEYVEYANDEVSITGRCLHTTGNDNLVDACYEMILKLHELKML